MGSEIGMGLKEVRRLDDSGSRENRGLLSGLVLPKVFISLNGPQIPELPSRGTVEFIISQKIMAMYVAEVVYYDNGKWRHVDASATIQSLLHKLTPSNCS